MLAPRFNAGKPNPGESRSPVGTEQGNLFLQEPTASSPFRTTAQAANPSLPYFPSWTNRRINLQFAHEICQINSIPPHLH